jgi:hypothetical protein
MKPVNESNGAILRQLEIQFQPETEGCAFPSSLSLGRKDIFQLPSGREFLLLVRVLKEASGFWSA